MPTALSDALQTRSRSGYPRLPEKGSTAGRPQQASTVGCACCLAPGERTQGEDRAAPEQRRGTEEELSRVRCQQGAALPALALGMWVRRMVCVHKAEPRSLSTAFSCPCHGPGSMTATYGTHPKMRKHLFPEAFQKEMLVNQSMLNLGYKEGNPYQRGKRNLFMATTEDHP